MVDLTASFVLYVNSPDSRIPPLCSVLIPHEDTLVQQTHGLSPAIKHFITNRIWIRIS